ncbi:MAG: DUF2207 domain-containing protein [Fimbriimonadaceae bacterium]
MPRIPLRHLTVSISVRRILIWLMLLCLPLAARAEAFFINQFDVDLDLQKNGELRVTENIQVVFTAPRHGIFRTLPVEMPTPSGFKRLVLVDDIQVSDTTGNKSGMKVDKEGSNLKIRIGDPDAYAPVGPVVTYTIRYRVTGMLNRFDPSGGWGRNVELYWNALGTEWPVGIQKSQVTVRWPEGAQPKEVRAVTFWGNYGSRTQFQQIGAGTTVEPTTGIKMELTPTTLRITNPQPLLPYQGLSFALSMPSTLIDMPSLWQEFRLKYAHLMGFLVPLGMAVVFFVIWFIWGRDPVHKRGEPQAEVPHELTGALAGALADGRFDEHDLSAVFVSLAKKGRLVLNPGGLGEMLTLTSNSSTQGLDDLEAYVLNLLLPHGPSISKTDLTEYVAPHLWQIKAKAFGELVKRGYYRSNPQSVQLAWGIIGLVLLVIVSMVVWSLAPYFSRDVVLLGFFLGLGGLYLFARVMPRLTRRGSRAYAEVQAFAEFLDDAGLHRAKLKGRPMDQTLYEDYLDHAVAFRRVKRWGHAFSALDLVRPGWITGRGSAHDLNNLGNELGGFASELGKAASTPPKSSGGSW